MSAEWTPMRWPSAWKDPSALEMLKGTAVNYLLVEAGAEFELVRAQARQAGLQVAEADALPQGVTEVEGEWPGIRPRRGAGAADASSGPTGAAWVDSNGWAVRLARMRAPSKEVWVKAAPAQNARITPDAFQVAVADSASHGARWIMTLGDQLAAGIAAKETRAMESWKQAMASASLFAAHKEWAGYMADGLIGVISNYSGDNEFFSNETLNLLARAGAAYRILEKDKLGGDSFARLRAVLYGDGDAPPADVRQKVLAFVQSGGMLITGKQWGAVAGARQQADQHPSFNSFVLGRGRVEVAKEELSDPYVFANDSVVVVSHRYDMVRFWNGGSTGFYYTMSPDRKKALVHLMFYANRGPDSASVRVVGKFRTAKIWSVDHPAGQSVDLLQQQDAVEVHLPQVPQYVGLELDV